jgi:hypothetical protein
MNNEISGTLIAKYDTQVISEKFKKREFVVEFREDVNGQPGQYANYAKMQLVNAKTDIIDNFNIGDEVKVSFNIRGNRYEKNGTVGYITNLDAWRINKAGAGEENRAYSAPSNNAPSAPAAAPDFVTGSTDIVDDLPF